jgi:glycine cleavage system H protein
MLLLLRRCPSSPLRNVAGSPAYRPATATATAAAGVAIIAPRALAAQAPSARRTYVPGADPAVYYTTDHEYLRVEDDGVSATVGITDFAQNSLGDIVYVEIELDAGDIVNMNDAIGAVESVKAASEIFCPASGEITDVNEDIADSPEILNKAPEADGWLFRMKLSDPDQLADMMDAETYAELCEKSES